MIDPALQEQIAFGRPEDETEAVMLLQPGHDPPPPARLVARFGDVVTCRLDVNAIVEVRRHPWVLALKASRAYGGTEFVAGEPELPAVPGATVRRGPWGATGTGVILAVLDWGCDFAHPNFRRDDGRTRLLALWDQRRPARAGNRYGYGTIYRSHEIDRALFSADPYAALGYHPDEADPSKRGTHGCHVMDIAAGNGRLRGSAVGVACDAHLIFVHLAARITPPLQDLGDCVRVLEAIDFVRQTAGTRPWVVNMSLGRTGGDHTGRSLVERAIDSVLEEWPGRACVLSAGNYFARNLHAEGLLRPGGQAVLEWRIEPDDDTPNELEVWYSGRDRYVVRLVSPAGAVFAAGLDEKRSVVVDGLEVGRLYHRAKDSASGDHHVDLFLDPAAPAGSWQVILEGVDVVDGRYHAWIERDVSRAGQSTFAPEQSSSRSTIGTIANGYRTLVVGAYDPATGEPAGFSSAGPTRDGRYKPDISAPGKDILAARSTPRGLAPGQGGLVSMSGTSMAAPHVAGAVALLFEAAGRPLHIEETRALLLGHASACEEECDPARVGAGRLDMDRALAAVAGRLPAAHKGGAIAMPTSDATFRTLEEIEQAADRLYGEAIAGSTGRLSGVQVVALPGQRVPAPLLGSVGDLVLVRVALGEPGLGYAAALAGTALATSQQLAVQGVAVEEGPPGGYAVVVERQGLPGPPRARRITDADGIVPPGQMLLRAPRPDELAGGDGNAEDVQGKKTTIPDNPAQKMADEYAVDLAVWVIDDIMERGTGRLIKDEGPTRYRDSLTALHQFVNKSASNRAPVRGRRGVELYDWMKQDLAAVLPKLPAHQRERIVRLGTDVLLWQARDRVTGSVTIDGKVFEIPDDAHPREQAALLRRTLPKLVEALKMANEQIIRLPHLHAHLTKDLENLKLLKDQQMPADLPGKLVHLQNLLFMVDGWLTLDDEHFQHELKNIRGVFHGIATYSELVLGVVELVGGGLSFTATLAAGLAKLVGQATVAATASAVARSAGHLLANVVAGIEIVHGVFVLLDPRSTNAQKEKAVVGIGTSIGWFLAGGPGSIAVLATYFVVLGAAHLYWEGALGLTTGLMRVTFEHMQDVAGGIARLVDHRARAEQLRLQEKNAEKAAALATVEGEYVNLTAARVDGFLDDCDPNVKGHGWGSSNIAAYPANYTILREAFAPLLAKRGAKGAAAVMAAATAVLEKVSWCFAYAAEIVVFSAKNKHLSDVEAQIASRSKAH